MQTIATIGLDIAKLVFQVHGANAAGQVILSRKLKRCWRPPQEAIERNMPFKRKQSGLVDLPIPHHDFQSLLLAAIESVNVMRRGNELFNGTGAPSDCVATQLYL